jgi:hypothetical protein
LRATLALLALGLCASCGDGALRPVVRAPDAGVALPPCGGCVFPAAPLIVDVPGAPTVPEDVASRFGASDAGATTGGPCLVEPQMGSLFPENWLRPRFRWNVLPPRSIVELRLRVDVESNDLVVYTNGTSWTMDEAIWTGLSRSAPGHPISVSVRRISLDDPTPVPAEGSHGTISIAPVAAPGSIVYWSIKADTGETALKGFEVGQETVQTVVTPTPGRCIGCHAATPDGELVAFSDADMPDGQYAFVGLRSSRDGVSQPSFLTAAARTLLSRRNQHLATFSPAHWRAGDHVAVSLLNLRLVWTDLEAASTDVGVGWGPLAIDGDPGPTPAWPSWSHDGTFLVYASGQGTIFGGVLSNADVYRVPYDDRRGGTATPVPGASDPGWNEFYPTLSPDDRLLAFSRVRAQDGDSYNNRLAEVFVVPVSGGEPTRVVANDPGPCQGGISPGVMNSWPKWAPDATVTGGKTYYWLTFSSTRGAGVPQLYVTPVVAAGDTGELTTFPALYLWNQPAAEGNHTPAWDDFQIPIQ